MLTNVSEQRMHIVRWVLMIGWGMLIVSLFYDPVSAVLTDPNARWGLLPDHLLLSHPVSDCVTVQDVCLRLQPYAVATRVFWGMVVPAGIFIVFVLGHETWRRICPLYFFSQIPRALGLTPRLSIKTLPWLERNHLYVQFSLFFIGLNSRILFINSVRPILGVFLVLTLLSAATVVWLFGGRSWCHYVCPFGMVQTVFTGPRGLFDSTAHTAASKSVTQSMCRTVDGVGSERSACISCKTVCMDIDSEKSYWEHLTQPGRRFVQYGYLGLVLGYFLYYWLYAGNFRYYFSGVWSHEPDALANVLKPGFYWFGTPLPIPKLVAAPLTLGLFAIASYGLGCVLEKYYRGYLKRKAPYLSPTQGIHRLYSVCTFLAFNIFFIYGGRPEINTWPLACQIGFQALIGLVSGIWLYRTWGRTADQYLRESLTDKLKRQLAKLPSELLRPLEGQSIEHLGPDEVYVLAKTLPYTAQYNRLNLYKGVLQDALQAGQVDSSNSLMRLHYLQQQLEITPQQHYELLADLHAQLDTQQWIHPPGPPLPRTVLRKGANSARTILRSDRQD